MGNVLIQCGDHLENHRRIISLGHGIRALGHNPVALVYAEHQGATLLAEGLDVYALRLKRQDGPLSRRLRAKRARSLGMDSTYRGVSMADLLNVDAFRAPYRFTAEKLGARMREAVRYVDAVSLALRQVNPTHCFIWNGYTGLCANALRLLVSLDRIPAMYMERAPRADSVFVDPKGVNGYSALSSHPASEIDSSVVGRDFFLDATTLAESEPALVSSLRSRYERIVFVPLQVQLDTNIILHSQQIKSMREFVSRVADAAHGRTHAVVVRPHPEEVEKLRLPAREHVYVTGEGDLGAWLTAADLVVTINSTVGLEALIAGTPVVALGNSIYAKKELARFVGVDDLPEVLNDEASYQAPSRRRVRQFFNYLMNRHVCSPGHTAAAVEEFFREYRARDPGETHPPVFNEAGLAPLRAQRISRRVWRNLFEISGRKGRLTIYFDVRPRDLLNLSYRNPGVPFSLDWFEKQLTSKWGDHSWRELEVHYEASIPWRPRRPAILVVPCGRRRAIRWRDVLVFDAVVDPYLALNPDFLSAKARTI